MAAMSRLAGKRVYLDANVFIYALDNLPPWNENAASLLRAIEAGELKAVTCELTLAECLVKPFQTGSQQSILVYMQTIQTRPNLTVVPASREVLVEAARLRATSGLKLPDAIHVAAGILSGCEAFVTNDQRIGSSAAAACVLLSDLTAN